jgi:Uncharacterised ACR (DUF711)
MPSQKIVRTICYFTPNPGPATVQALDDVARRLQENDYLVQTQRICAPNIKIKHFDRNFMGTEVFLSAGALTLDAAKDQIDDFYRSSNLSFHIDLTGEDIQEAHLDLLFDMIKNKPDKMFNFAYVFQNPPSSPYFPAARYGQEGFAIGLQPTDLAAGCDDLRAWLEQIRRVWHDLNDLLLHDRAFLGIDASIAPLFVGNSSLIHVINRFGLSFSASVTTDIYVTMADYLRQYNPRPIGLCGIMFPCLEDFGLAAEYDKGHFPIERNIYLSLHSGLGLDTYPLGVDEEPATLLPILRLLQGLAKKYGKALSARFVSDGQARVGERTAFGHPYLKDVTIRPLLSASPPPA